MSAGWLTKVPHIKIKWNPCYFFPKDLFCFSNNLTHRWHCRRYLEALTYKRTCQPDNKLSLTLYFFHVNSIRIYWSTASNVHHNYLTGPRYLGQKALAGVVALQGNPSTHFDLVVLKIVLFLESSLFRKFNNQILVQE